MVKYFLLPHVGQFFNTENEILREKKSQNDGCGGNMKKKKLKLVKVWGITIETQSYL